MANSRWLIGLLTVVYGLSTYSCSIRDSKFQQYYVQGQTLYEKHCSNCHQKNGKGLGLVYPPLEQSDYLMKNINRSFCIMKYGTSGEVLVNGKSFNKSMPGIPSLTELEIAEVATYISNSWGNEYKRVEISEVDSVLRNCETR
ncbi:MAG: cytochrome c [Cyclobacteriaceae bacterium]